MKAIGGIALPTSSANLDPRLVAALSSLRDLDAYAAQRAAYRLSQLTLPRGGLGTWKDTLVRLAGITGQVIPAPLQPVALIFAADHGLADEGISAYRQEVTEQMATAMAMGYGTASVLARHLGIPWEIVDVGLTRPPRHPGVIGRRVRPGTANMRFGPAMTRTEAVAAVHVGLERATHWAEQGRTLIIVGEIGIANTSSAVAMASVLLHRPVSELTGYGSGITEDVRQKKVAILKDVLSDRHPDPEDPWDVLAAVGGLEIAALAGAIIGAGARQLPIFLDGLVPSVAALWASRLDSRLSQYVLASHQSSEPAHQAVLAALGLTPLADWGLGIGEGSGALLMLPALTAMVTLYRELTTFEEARVDNPYPPATKPGPLSPMVRPTPNDFSPQETEAVYKAILARRDIRIYLPDPIPDDVLHRILMAGHHAPSVGFMQPWDFVIVTDPEIRRRLHALVDQERVRAAAGYHDLRQAHYLRLKVEGLKDAPVTICVTNNAHRAGPHVLGRSTMPETDLMSCACAIENMWLAARAEGIAMGWVSIYQKHDVREVLHLPATVDPIALLTVGYTPHFPPIPVLEQVGWRSRRPLDHHLHQDHWHSRPDENV